MEDLLDNGAQTGSNAGITNPSDYAALYAASLERIHQLEAQQDAAAAAEQPPRPDSTSELLRLLITELRSNPPAAPPAPAIRRSIEDDDPKPKRLPDPEPFECAEKGPAYNAWSTAVKIKLDEDARDFPTEARRIAYVYGRTIGEAQEILEPRMPRVNPNAPWQSVEEMFETLDSAYGEADPVGTAKKTFRNLFMKKDQTFPQFHVKFLAAASKGQIPKSEWRTELRDKVQTDLRRLIMPVFRTLTTYNEVATAFNEYDQDLRLILAQEARYGTRDSKLKNNDNDKKPTAGATAKPTSGFPTGAGRSTTPAPKDNPTPRARAETPFAHARPTYSDPTRQSLSNEGKCFNCQKPGHMARECPEPRRAASVNEIEEVVGFTKESGKEQP